MNYRDILIVIKVIIRKICSWRLEGTTMDDLKPALGCPCAPLQAIAYLGGFLIFNFL